MTTPDDAWLVRVAHEMRTPLNAILGYAQLLQIDSPPGSREAEAAQMISAAGQHLLGLASDLLDQRCLQAGSFALCPQSFPLPRLLDDVSGMARIATRAKGLAFQRSDAASLPERVVGDEMRLRQVLLNLLANAVKFTHRGGVTLAVTARALAGARCLLHFEVSDTGIGIPAEHIGRLFRPFVRLGTPSGASSGAVAGAGLGLSISRDLVRAMGSDIEVAGVPGGGTRFAFAIDLAHAPAAPTVEAAAVAPAAWPAWHGAGACPPGVMPTAS